MRPHAVCVRLDIPDEPAQRDFAQLAKSPLPIPLPPCRILLLLPLPRSPSAPSTMVVIPISSLVSLPR